VLQQPLFGLEVSVSGKGHIDHLLARGKLSGARREEILQRALDAAAPEPQPWWQRLKILWLTPVVSTAAILVLFLVPQKQFRAKGGAGTPTLDVGCAKQDPHRCTSGDTLMFRVDGTGYLSAYAEPVGNIGGGERVWYFGAPERVESVGVLKRGVRIGGEQPPGKYRVELILSSRPLSRDEASSSREGTRRSVELEVLP
jgi:hypothetical protein